MEYRSEYIVLTAEALVTTPARIRKLMSFAGVILASQTFVSLFKIKQSPHHYWDPSSRQIDVDQLALTLYGDQQVQGESLRARVEKECIKELVQIELGSSAEKWRRFIQGEKVKGEYNDQVVESVCENIFTSRISFLATTAKQRRTLRFAGFGLPSLATALGVSSKEMNPYAEQGMSIIADTLFGTT